MSVRPNQHWYMAKIRRKVGKRKTKYFYHLNQIKLLNPCNTLHIDTLFVGEFPVNLAALFSEV